MKCIFSQFLRKAAQLFLLFLLLFFGCGSGTHVFNNANITGFVQSAGKPLGSFQVTLYETGTGMGPKSLGQAASDASDGFIISYDSPTDPQAVLYIQADGRPNQPILFTAMLGVGKAPERVVINEHTTVAAAYAMAQFIIPGGIDGTNPGLQNAAAIAGNLADVRSGDIAAVLASSPNGDATSTLPLFNSLSNLLAACVASSANCNSLFNLATPPQGETPSETFSAMVNIAHFPSQNAAGLLQLAQVAPSYSPALAPSATLDAWTLALRYAGYGQELDGPGNIAFDSAGNAWITNNYIFHESSFDPAGTVCGDDHILRLTPTGEDAPGAPYEGGGLYGAGFGIGLDPDENVWIGNFGFQGSNCPNDTLELARTVSAFNSQGVALSPNSQGNSSGQDHGGFPGAGNTIVQPQGTVSDLSGNIWIANCGGNSVTQFPKGNPAAAFAIAPLDSSNSPLLVNPFDIAIDGSGHAWVTSNDNNSVFSFDSAGNLLHSLTGAEAIAAGLDRPMGLATDSLGNVWVANSGIIHLPCEGSSGNPQDAVDESNQPGFNGATASVTLVNANGQASVHGAFKGGGLILPWGIAVDGNNNIWVANFAGQRLSELCGAQPQNCPPGLSTGDPISPANGYSSDSLVRNTGVAIDPSGNVWLANNWQTLPIQQNPGGHEVVLFIGLAKPVQAPLIGPPQTNQ